MASATHFPKTTDLAFFQWSTPDNSRPTLRVGASASAGTLQWSAAPRDKDGAIITAPFLAGIKVMSRANRGYIEIVYCPNGADGASGLSSTGCIRGIRISGFDYTTGDSDYAVQHFAGDEVFCADTAVIAELLRQTLQGGAATGANSLIIGSDNAAATVTIFRSTTAGNSLGFLRWNLSTGKVEYNNDGTAPSWNSIDSVTASNLVVVSGADTTPSNLNAKVTVTDGRLTKAILNPGANETLDLTLTTTSSTAELNKLTGTSANVTPANLNTLTAGPVSNADLLHTHSSPNLGFVAAESINGSSNTQAISLLGENFKKSIFINANGRVYFDTGVGTDRQVGDVDARTRLAQSFSITDVDAATIKLENITIELQKTSSPVDNIFAEIQTDSAGSPSGTVITNGTSDSINGASLFAFMTTQKFVWSTPPTLTSGTTYWIVFRRSGINDATNYYRILDAGASTYAGGSAATYTASSGLWASIPNDLQMQILMELDYDGKVVKGDSDDLKKCNFIGLSSDNKTAGQTLAVAVDSYKSGFSSTLVRGANYYLDTTAGGITTNKSLVLNTKPSIRIGRAVSTSEILILPQKQFMFFQNATTNGAAFTFSEAGGVTTSTFDLFIETGFQPEEIDIVYFLDLTATSNDDEFAQARFFGTTQLTPFYGTGILDAGGPPNLVAPSATQPSYIVVQEICENGVIIRFNCTNALVFNTFSLSIRG